MSIDEQDESVRIAIRALGDMRNSGARPQSPPSGRSTSFQNTPALTVASSSSSPSTASLLLPEDVNQADFVSRVSQVPIVSTALKAYENSKASSRVVKYGAEMMESSVRSISKPVIDRLPVNQLDEFACRQLDRFGTYGCRSPPDNERMSIDPQLRSRSPSMERPSPSRRSSASPWRERRRKDKERDFSNRDVSMASVDVDDDGDEQMRDRSRPNTPTQSTSSVYGRRDRDEDDRRSQIVPAPRSRWQAMLLEAGGLSAAVSEESMRKLKYCLQWLQYATAHVDAQILVLRDFIASLQPGGTNDTVVSLSQMRTVENVKKDIVHTIRQVVDVMSKYTAGALPEPARGRVRAFVLSLPQRLAASSNRARREDPSSASASVTSSPLAMSTSLPSLRARGAKPYSREPSRPSSPARSLSSAPSSPRMARLDGHLHSRGGSGSHGSSHPPFTTGTATAAAQKVLTLATETLDMMRGVTGVVKDSLDRADAWVDRLRVVGIQRQGQHAPDVPSRSSSPSSSHAASGSGSSSRDEFWSATSSAPPPLPSPLPLTGLPPFLHGFPDVPKDVPSPIGATLDEMNSLSLQGPGSAYVTPKMTPRNLGAGEEGRRSGI